MRSTLPEETIALLDWIVALPGEGAWEAALDEVRFAPLPDQEADNLKHSVLQAEAQLSAGEFNAALDEIQRALDASSAQVRTDNRSDEYDLSPETRPYSPRQFANDYDPFSEPYRVYLDSSSRTDETGNDVRLGINSLERDVIVEWSKSARLNSQKFTARVDVAIIDRSDYWDGFVIRDKHILLTKAIYHIRTDLPGRDKADFAIGPIIVSPGSHAVCGMCRLSRSWSRNLHGLSESEQRETATEILEHAFNVHDHKNYAGARIVPTCKRTYLSSPEGKFAPVKVSVLDSRNPWQ
jgi:hypothetical protein